MKYPLRRLPPEECWRRETTYTIQKNNIRRAQRAQNSYPPLSPNKGVFRERAPHSLFTNNYMYIYTYITHASATSAAAAAAFFGFRTNIVFTQVLFAGDVYVVSEKWNKYIYLRDQLRYAPYCELLNFYQWQFELIEITTSTFNNQFHKLPTNALYKHWLFIPLRGTC